MQVQRLFQEAQALQQRGQNAAALQRYEQLLDLQADHAPARICRAVLLQLLGRPREALQEAEAAVAAMGQPNPGVLINYGVVLKNAGRLDAAARAYEQALELVPTLQPAQANLATIYFLQGRLDEAEQRFLALTDTMEDPAPWLNLARIAQRRGQNDQARDHLRRAEDLDPSHPDVALLQARLAKQEGDDEAAWQACLRGLSASPAHRALWQVLQGLDAAVFNLDQLEQLLAALARLEVDSATVLSIAVDLCRKHWLWRPLAELEHRLGPALLQRPDRIPSSADVFTLLGADVPQRAHLAAAGLCWQGLTQGVRPLSPPEPEPLEGRRLRVAFLSSDLRGHAIGHLVVGLFEHLPSERIEWWAYHNTFHDASAVRERLRAPFERSITVAKLSDPQLAERIRSDGIDVLIDLNQMTAHTRATVMAYRPAPLQIQWLGMPGSLGAGDAVDYVIVDPWVADEANADGFSECLLMLPRSYQPNDHQPPDLTPCASRSAAGLPEDAIVLGVFNQFYKFSPDTFALWGEIFRQLPDQAVLWLLDPASEQLKARILRQAAAEGIIESRVVFAPRCSQEAHLARLQWMDLVLDTWPYNAHTTASDALRAGVPVLTLPHGTFASRVAAGILHSAGLSEWVAASPADYVAKAVAFARLGRAGIDAAKAELRATYWGSAMVDNAAMGRQFEAALLALYERAVAAEAPTSLRLEADLSLTPLPFGRQADGPIPGSDLETLAAEPASSARDDAEPDAMADRPAWADQLERGSRTARLTNLAVLQSQLLGLSVPPVLLDVGRSEPGTHAYDLLAEKQLLIQHKAAAADVLDGSRASWHRYQAHDLGSHRSLRADWLALFPGYGHWGALQASEEHATSSLADLLPSGSAPARMAHLDLRGSELVALQRCPELLADLALLQCKTAPSPLHQGGASLFELGHWLQQQGFVLHMFTNENKRLFRPFGRDDNPFAGRNQLMQLDAVFMPDPLTWSDLAEDRLLALAFLAHTLYRSTDVAMLALDRLDRRDRGERVRLLQQYLEAAGADA